MMKKSSGGIAETVRALAEPVAESLGYFIWDVEYVKEGARQILRITIDTEADEGITIEDCEKMHRTIDPVLDEADPIECAYYLEVSSPGIERELRTPAHVDAWVGEEVELRLFAPMEGKKSFEGILAGRSEAGEILLDMDGTVRAFPRESVAKLTTIFRF